tara:strand:+ start:13700 stop:14701 length:1002 start_codon:yes stop_codon:yes gene_type:complete
MPIDRLGSEKDPVQVLRASTPLEDAYTDAASRTAGLGELWPFAPHFFEVDGEFLHYIDEGPRDAPVLLCVHGNPTWGFMWREVVREFSDRFRVIVPDHMGMGLSGRPHDWDYCLAGHQAALESLVESLDLRDVSLLVHDWGGPIGLGVAAKHPERYARFVIANTGCWPEGPMPWGLRIGKLPLIGNLAIRTMGVMDGLVSALCTTRGLTPDVASGFRAPYGGYGDRAAMHAFVEDIPLSRRHRSHDTLARVDAALPALAARPTMLLWGLQDWVFTPAFLRGFRERFPRAQVHTFEDAGHLVYEDARGPCLDRLRHFFHTTGAVASPERETAQA